MAIQMLLHTFYDYFLLALLWLTIITAPPYVSSRHKNTNSSKGNIFIKNVHFILPFLAFIGDLLFTFIIICPPLTNVNLKFKQNKKLSYITQPYRDKLIFIHSLILSQSSLPILPVTNRMLSFVIVMICSHRTIDALFNLLSLGFGVMIA